MAWIKLLGSVVFILIVTGCYHESLMLAYSPAAYVVETVLIATPEKTSPSLKGQRQQKSALDRILFMYLEATDVDDSWQGEVNDLSEHLLPTVELSRKLCLTHNPSWRVILVPPKNSDAYFKDQRRLLFSGVHVPATLACLEPMESWMGEGSGIEAIDPTWIYFGLGYEGLDPSRHTSEYQMLAVDDDGAISISQSSSFPEDLLKMDRRNKLKIETEVGKLLPVLLEVRPEPSTDMLPRLCLAGYKGRGSCTQDYRIKGKSFLGEQAPYIINLGLPKTGTSSLHKILYELGVNNDHWQCANKLQRMGEDRRFKEWAQKIDEAPICNHCECAAVDKCGALVEYTMTQTNFRPFDLLVENAQTQLDCMSYNVFFVPQWQRLPEILKAYSPDEIVFTLTTRDTKSWVTSVGKWHNNMEERFRTMLNSTEDTFLSDFKEKHEDRVRRLLASSHHQLIEVDISAPEADMLASVTALEDRLRVPISKRLRSYLWTNRNPK